MKHVRIFAAVNLSIASVRKIADLQQELRKGTPAGLKVRWVPPANLHATVKFYGHLAPEQVVAVKDAAQKAVDGLRPFALATRGVGVFPDLQRPRVIWVGLQDGVEALQTLRSRLEEASEALGFERDPRAFRPHLTIGRIKAGQDGLAEWLETHAEADCLISTVEELVIYESRLHRAGAEYIAQGRFPIGIPATPAAEVPEPEAPQAAQGDDTE